MTKYLELASLTLRILPNFLDKSHRDLHIKKGAENYTKNRTKNEEPQTLAGHGTQR